LRTCPTASAWDRIATFHQSFTDPVPATGNSAATLALDTGNEAGTTGGTITYDGTEDATYVIRITRVQSAVTSGSFSGDASTTTPGDGVLECDTFNSNPADACFYGVEVGDYVNPGADAYAHKVVDIASVNQITVTLSDTCADCGSGGSVGSGIFAGATLNFGPVKDQFTYSIDGGACQSQQSVSSAGVSVGSDGLRVVFSANTGFSLGDEWTIQAKANQDVDFDGTDHNQAHQMEECAGRGLCDRDSGQCRCFTGFSGEACARATCPNDCSGHGVCQSISSFATDGSETYNSLSWDYNKEYGCKCDAGYRGGDCSLMECPSGADPLLSDLDASGTRESFGNDCSARGLCNYETGLCECFKGFYGERCERQSVFI
jgi:hypothetical protein